MRVRDERREGGCLWAGWGGSSWKDTKDEGPHFKNQRLDQSDECHLPHPNIQTHYLSLSLKKKEESVK